MASAVDICNEALGEIGARVTINGFADGTPASLNCGLYYDRLRKALIRTAPWGFCRKQATLSMLKDVANGDTVPYPWRIEYLYPPDCLKLRYVLVPIQSTVTEGVPVTGDVIYPGLGGASRKNKFMVMQDIDSNQRSRKVVVANCKRAIGVYSADEGNVDMFDSLYWEALVAALASKLVMPLTGNAGMKTTYEQLCKMKIEEARSADGNEALPTVDHTPDWMKARGCGTSFPYDGLNNQYGYYSESWSNMSWGD